MSAQQLIAAITKNLFNPLITALFAVATLVFAWGVVLYIIGSYGSDSRIERAKSIMFWGVIGMFIMASAWGIVGMLCNFFNAYGTAC
jgi:hypothetical protein